MPWSSAVGPITEPCRAIGPVPTAGQLVALVAVLPSGQVTVTTTGTGTTGVGGVTTGTTGAGGGVTTTTGTTGAGAGDESPPPPPQADMSTATKAVPKLLTIFFMTFS